MQAASIGFAIQYMTPFSFLKNDEIDKVISERVNLHTEKLRAFHPDELRKSSAYQISNN